VKVQVGWKGGEEEEKGWEGWTLCGDYLIVINDIATSSSDVVGGEELGKN